MKKKISKEFFFLKFTVHHGPRVKNNGPRNGPRAPKTVHVAKTTVHGIRESQSPNSTMFSTYTHTDSGLRAQRSKHLHFPFFAHTHTRPHAWLWRSPVASPVSVCACAHRQRSMRTCAHDPNPKPLRTLSARAHGLESAHQAGVLSHSWLVGNIPPRVIRSSSCQSVDGIYFARPRDIMHEEVHTPAHVMLMHPAPPFNVGTGKINSAGRGSPAGTNSTLCRGWRGSGTSTTATEFLVKSSGNIYSVNSPMGTSNGGTGWERASTDG